MRDTDEKPLALSSFRRGLISLFIAFNILAVVCGSTRPLPEQNIIQKSVLPYLVWTRLLQSWQLFTPSPRKSRLNYRAEIKFKNGKEVTWRRPYPPNWDFFPRHLAYQFQKWDLASNYLERPGMNRLLWQDLSTFLERAYRDDANPPQTITLIRSEAPIPPPIERGYVGLDHEDQELVWQDRPVFIYSVSEKSIR